MKKLHPQIERAIGAIEMCIIDLVILNKGRVLLKELEAHTGLKVVGVHVMAEILAYMEKKYIIAIAGEAVIGDLKKLAKIKAQQKVKLPKNHNKLWDDQSIVMLCEEYNKNKTAKHRVKIANKLGRSEHSVNEMMSRLRLAHKIIPMIKKYKAIREFVEASRGPKPTDDHNQKAA